MTVSIPHTQGSKYEKYNRYITHRLENVDNYIARILFNVGLMNRKPNFKNMSELTYQEVSKKIAVHEAGHAAAIYFGNKQKGLPPVFFQIVIKSLNSDVQSSECLGSPSDQYIAKVEGGRLIHTLPTSLDEATKDFSTVQRLAYEHAFEADMFNLS